MNADQAYTIFVFVETSFALVLIGYAAVQGIRSMISERRSRKQAEADAREAAAAPPRPEPTAEERAAHRAMLLSQGWVEVWPGMYHLPRRRSDLLSVPTGRGFFVHENNDVLK